MVFTTFLFNKKNAKFSNKANQLTAKHHLVIKHIKFMIFYTIFKFAFTRFNFYFFSSAFETLSSKILYEKQGSTNR